MQKLTFFFLLLLSSCLSSPQQPSKLIKSIRGHLTGKVIAVKDGDSLELLDGDTTIHQIRLAHVDCPENKQAFGKRAKIFTANFCFGKVVSIRPTDKDRYGRVVGEVIVEGKELNLELIKAGMGWHFKKYSDSESHAAAERKAKRKKLGLWSQKNPIAPWEYRKR